MAKNKQQIKFEADISGFKSAIKEGETSIKSLNKELKLNKEQLKENNSSTDLLTTRVKTLQQQYQEQTKIVEESNACYEKAVELFGENSEEAKKWKDKIVEAETKQQKIKNAINETNEEIKKQTSSWIDNGKALQEAGSIVEKVGDKMNKVGSKLSIVSASVAGGLIATTKASIDYESAFAGVEKTVDATEEELQALNKGILDMSTRMPAAATEIAGVAESAGQLGIKTENILSFSEAMIGLGEATNLTADEASSQLAKFANIMDMSQADFDKLGSSIVDLGNNFATTEADIVEMAMRLAGAGKQVGLSEGQVLGLATALSSVGIEAEMGGSAISKAMVKMQNAVDLGGGKLQTVLKKAGMSLHEMELMAANDSKGFKELANSLDMTSTELKQMITAGTNLEDFAKVSGMTAEQFKKAWKEDAAGALSAFIQGLGHAEDKGESAITMLSEMGLTEVRLRDSLLRAANAGDLFNNAIETGTKAWEENTALTNEVNKRYGTTESQMKMLKNEVTKLAIEFGNELAPTLRDLLKDVKPLLSNVSAWIKKFSQLDDKTKKNTIKILALTVAVGPLVKTVGSLTSTTGKAMNTIGKLSEKIGEMKKNTTSATSATSSFSTGIGIASAAITLATAAVVAHEYAMNKIERTVKNNASYMYDLKSATDELKASRDEFNKTQQETLNKNLTEVDMLVNLKDELDKIVDSNGKVKEGCEKRANYIVGELSDALGIEIKMTDGVIQKYDELSKKIDDTISKQRASTIMEIVNNNYKEVLSSMKDNKKALQEATDAYNNEQSKLEETQKKYDKALELSNSITNKYVGKYTVLAEEAKKQLDTQKQVTEDARNNLDKRNKIYQDDLNKQADYTYYTKLYSQQTTDSYDKMYEKIMYDTTGIAKDSEEALNQTITSISEYLNTYKKMFEETNDERYKAEIENQEKLLAKQTETLVKMTSTTESLTPNIVSAWKTLANTSIDEYAVALNSLDDTTIAKIQVATGRVVSDEQLAEAFSKLGRNSVEGFKNVDITDAADTLTNNLKEKLLSRTGIFSLAGKTLGKSFTSGLSSVSGSSNVKTSNADGLAYVPYNGYVARLHEGERVLTKKENADYVRNNISNRSSNITVNFYPQQMTEAEIDRASRYINRKWGARA